MTKSQLIAEISRLTGNAPTLYEDDSISQLRTELAVAKARQNGNGPDPAPAPAPAPVPPAAPAGMDNPFALFAQFLEPHLSIKVNREEVDGLIASRLAEISPPALTINVERKDTRVTIEGAHRLLPKLLQLVSLSRNGHRRNVLLYGAPGGGKSHACRQVAETLGLRFGFVGLLPQSPKSDIFGFVDANGTFRDTEFFHCYTGGGVFLIDEIDNASDTLLTALNGAIENGHAAFPDGIHARHEDFILIAAANTAGRGGSRNHVGRRALDGATIDRFVYLQWGYDDALEESIVRAINSAPVAQTWLSWVRSVRAYSADHHPEVIASPRASADAAQLLLLEGAFAPEELADAVLFKGHGSDIVRNILANCPLPKEV